MISLYTIINTRIDNKLNTFAAFVDFQKAFDLVDRKFLLYKLLNIGIQGKLYFAIKSLLLNTTSCVKLNDIYTEEFHINTGIRQGDSISSTLFACFINDLVAEINNNKLGINIGNHRVSCLLYADDLVILSENEVNLQAMLISLCNWCEKWNIKINIKKSNIILFHPNRRKNSEFEFKINNQVINDVDYYKYLGVYMDANLKMNITIKRFAESGSRSLGTIISKYKLMPSMCFQTYTKLFNACVFAMMIYLGVNKFAAKCAVIGDMGWKPGDIRRKLNLLRYWNRLVLLPNTRITKIIFLGSYNFEEKASICLHIREVLKEINFENLYYLLNVCDLTAAESKNMKPNGKMKYIVNQNYVFINN